MRALAGIVFGLPLAAGLAGLLVLLPIPGGDAGVVTATLLLLPLWLIGIVVATAQATRSRAWWLLGGGMLAAQALLWIVKLSGCARWPA